MTMPDVNLGKLVPLEVHRRVGNAKIGKKYFSMSEWGVPKFTPKQWRWADVLACFNVDLIHKLGRDNVVPDALSRRQELQIIFTGESSLMRKIREGYQAMKNPRKLSTR